CDRKTCAGNKKNTAAARHPQETGPLSPPPASDPRIKSWRRIAYDLPLAHCARERPQPRAFPLRGG
ncbi:MAG: hypothetical protein KAI47_27960, partial [Deltaproteobacteria bacterium]|nr:hypothetical protein [Deltaproteobacteria bacterium]